MSFLVMGRELAWANAGEDDEEDRTKRPLSTYAQNDADSELERLSRDESLRVSAVLSLRGTIFAETASVQFRLSSSPGGLRT